MNRWIKLWLVLLTAVLLSACMEKSLNTLDTHASHSANIGQLFDAPLVNMNYHTNNFVGTTSSRGEFLYFPDETITFTLGNHHFKNIKASAHLSIKDLFKETDLHNSVMNLHRLLQSIGQPTNKNTMRLPDLTGFDLAPLDFSQSLALFANDPQVLKLLVVHGNQANPLQLVPAEVVLDQLQIIPVTKKVFVKSQSNDHTVQITSL